MNAPHKTFRDSQGLTGTYRDSQGFTGTRKDF